MSKDLNDVAPSKGEVSTLYVALEVSASSWVVGIGDPELDKIGMHKLAPADTGGLLERIGKACAGEGGPSRVLLTYEAGYEGFWLARWLGEHAPEIDVVICDPASLEVVRRKRRAKTDRIDARKMVRALRAWDGGDRDAMSPVRIPTVEEEDAKRLLRRRERLVKERLRLANAIAGLLRLQGVPAGNPAGKGFRARLDGLQTGYGRELPPVLLAEIHGINLDDINFSGREILVRGKGSKERWVLFGQPTEDALQEYLRESRPKLLDSPTQALFLNRYGQRLSRRSYENLVRRYSAGAGLRDGVHTHTLRHTFASHMLEGDADLRVIQELLGHSSPTTTQIYTHITKQEARNAYLNCHPLASRS